VVTCEAAAMPEVIEDGVTGCSSLHAIRRPSRTRSRRSSGTPPEPVPWERRAGAPWPPTASNGSRGGSWTRLRLAVGGMRSDEPRPGLRNAEVHLLGGPPLLAVQWPAEENRRVFGNLTVAHGHNYVLEVTIRGAVASGDGHGPWTWRSSSACRRRRRPALRPRRPQRRSTLQPGVTFPPRRISWPAVWDLLLPSSGRSVSGGSGSGGSGLLCGVFRRVSALEASRGSTTSAPVTDSRAPRSPLRTTPASTAQCYRQQWAQLPVEVTVQGRRDPLTAWPPISGPRRRREAAGARSRGAHYESLERSAGARRHPHHGRESRAGLLGVGSPPPCPQERFAGVAVVETDNNTFENPAAEPWG